MKNIDETTLNFEQRLGLAYCRLNSWQWDDIIGPKPNDFDNIENLLVKNEYLYEPFQRIINIIGERNCNKYWWMFVLDKTEDEWVEWYYRDCDFLKNNNVKE